MKDIATSFALLVLSLMLLVGCGGSDSGQSFSWLLPPASPPPTEPPAAPVFTGPALVEVSAAGSSSIDVSWLPADDGTTPAGEMRYRVHAATLPDYLPGDATFRQEVAGAHSTRLTGLSSGTSYTVIVVAINGDGLTRTSLPLTVRTAGIISETIRGAEIAVPPEPAILSVSGDQILLQTGTPAPKVGQIIASAAGDGFLRRVVRVEDGASGVIVHTEPAALNEVLEQVEISSAFSMKTVPREMAPEGSGIAARSLAGVGKGSEWHWPETRFRLSSESMSRAPVHRSTRPAARLAAAKNSTASTMDVSSQLDQDIGNWATFSGPKLIGVLEGTRGSVDLNLAVTRDDVSGGKNIPVALCRVEIEDQERGSSDLFQLGYFQELETLQVDGYTAIRRALQHVSIDATSLAAREKPYRFTLRAYIDEAHNRCQGSFRFFTGWKEVLEIDVDVAVVSTPEFPQAEKATLTFKGEFEVDNNVDYTFDPELHVDINLNKERFSVPSIDYARIEARSRAELIQGFRVLSSRSATLDSTQPLIKPRKFVKVYMVGHVPIVMAGEFSADLRVQGSTTGAVTLNEELRYVLEDLHYGVVFENGDWRITQNIQPTWNLKIHGEGNAEASLKLSLLPKLSVRFYEVASGRLVLEPYLQAEAGVHGRVLADFTPSGSTTDADYWLTRGRLAGGVDAWVMADLSIWDKTLLKWPKTASIDDYTSYRRIPLLKDSPVVIAGLPALTAAVIDSSRHPADSRAVLVRGTATDVPNPFRDLFGGPASFLPFVTWTAPRVIALNDAHYAFLSPPAGSGEPGDFWVSLRAPGTYTVRLGGNSSMGGWARQVTEVLLDARDQNANTIPDYWENRFSLRGSGRAIAEGDPDSDGFSNLQEFNDGRNPLVADTDLPEAPKQTVVITKVLDDVPPEMGLVPEGGTTDDTWPEIRGTLSAALGSLQELKVYDNLTVELGTAIVTGTNWVFWPIDLSPGTHIFTAAVFDSRGQHGPLSDAWLLRIEAATRPLNDTGIDWCADGSTNFIDCQSVDTLYAGQDGHHGRDAQAKAGTLVKVGAGRAGFDFTKLGANGQPLAIQNAAWSDAGSEVDGTQWSCVKDNHTGLVWEVKTADPSSLHYRDHTYTWYNTDATSNGGFAGYANGGTCTGSNCDTQALVAAVNAQGWCGANDWRMPTVRELENIVDLSRYGPAIDTDYFPNMYEWDWFWSSSPSANDSNDAWSVGFGGGYANLYGNGKNGGARVRLVRAGQ